MTDTAVSTAAKSSAKASRPGTFSLLLNNTLATCGLVILIAVFLIALAAPLLPLVNPDVTAPANRLLPIFSDGHLLGTDHLGRDLLSRLIWGTRVSLAVGLSATIIAAFFGSLLGLVAGYAGGRVDAMIMRRDRYGDGLSIYPAGPRDCRGSWAGSSQCALRHCPSSISLSLPGTSAGSRWGYPVGSLSTRHGFPANRLLRSCSSKSCRMFCR